MSTAWLSLIADEIESDAGISTSANRTPAGYWKRIALAAENIAGAATAANANELGWMRRATLAFEALAGDSLTGGNDESEFGYLARIAYATGILGGGSYSGNFFRQIQLALVDYTGGAAFAPSMDFSDSRNSGYIAAVF